MGYSFQKEYTLNPQTPLIHFQHDTPGATLRASGVKPELDEFLTRKAKQEGCFDKGWLVKEKTDALNYKLRFRAMEEGEVVELGRGTPYDIYYGNMGDEQVKGVFRKTKMEVVCFIPELMELIDRYIAEFFIVKNFGRMRGKGFGSFIVSSNKTLSEKTIAAYLTEEYGKKNGKENSKNICYAFTVRPFEKELIFKKIKVIYSIIKSGISFGRASHPSLLFEYMKSKGIIDERTWLKTEVLPPNNRQPRTPSTKKYRYVRALLGVGDHIDFRGKLRCSVKIKNAEIERFPSPIFFKVIGNTVYYVAEKIDDSIYGKTFSFTTSSGSAKCSVPCKEDIGEDFFEGFLGFCKDRLNIAAKSRKFRDLQNVEIRRI